MSATMNVLLATSNLPRCAAREDHQFGGLQVGNSVTPRPANYLTRPALRPGNSVTPEAGEFRDANRRQAGEIVIAHTPSATDPAWNGPTELPPASNPRRYGGSAPPQADQSTTNPARRFVLDARQGGGPETVPVFTVIRSSKEEPDSAPAASPQVGRRPSPQPPGRRFHDFRGVPHPHGTGCAPLPAHIHQVRAGKALRGVMPSVPRVLLSDPLTGPTPSGSTGAPRLCQDCSHPTQRLPDRAVLSSYRTATTACCASLILRMVASLPVRLVRA